MRLLIALLFFSCAAVGARSVDEPNSAMESYEVQNPWSLDRAFRVRESMYLEGGIVGGAIYRFEVKNSRNGTWSLILEDRWDDPDPIACDAIRFVDAHLAYVHTRLKYAVSRDAGESWRVYELQDLLSLSPDKEHSLATIEAITLDKSGVGTLRVRRVTRDNPAVEFVTSDFGHSWKLKQSDGP